MIYWSINIAYDTHHLCLGVAMAGVEAVGTAGAGHRLSQPQRGEAEYLAWVARPQRLSHAPATQYSRRDLRHFRAERKRL